MRCSIVDSGWDMHDQVYSRELLISNKDNGYRDILAKIDLSTYRTLPWEGGIPFFLVSFLDPDTKEPICACPRSTVQKAVEKMKTMGWDCFAGVEYEVGSGYTFFA
jgi:glutamine synthetase